MFIVRPFPHTINTFQTPRHGVMNALMTSSVGSRAQRLKGSVAIDQLEENMFLFSHRGAGPSLSHRHTQGDLIRKGPDRLAGPRWTRSL